MAKRVTSIGGQALLEGILMVGPKKNVILPLLCCKNVFPGQILREIWG